MKILILIICMIPLVGYTQENLGCGGHEFNETMDKFLKENEPNHQRALQKLNAKAKQRSIPSPKFIWPLRATPAYQEIPNYYTISKYVDLDPAEDQVFDYNCGSKTYDGHKGCDITLWPFMWHMMDKEYVEVIAAADGIVTGLDFDNNNDSNCLGENSANTDNNGVVLTHADGSRSIYYHIKSFSTTVNMYDTVKAGDKIALVASSGYSSGPHLHFEVRDDNNNVIEPFVGTCNTTTTESWWQNQKPYWNPRVNRVMCHSANPQLVGYGASFCDLELVYGKNNFMPGDVIYFGIALTDILTGMEVEMDVYYPNGDNWLSTSYTHSGANDNALYVTSNSIVPVNAPSGTYKVRVDIGQDEFYHYFTVNCLSSQTVTSNLQYDNGYHVGTTLNCSSVLIASGFPPSFDDTSLKLQSGHEIKLTPGFHSPAGTHTYTKLRGCNFTH